MTLFRIRLLPAALFGSAAAVLACSTMAEFPSDGPAVDSLEPSRVQVTAVLGTAVISWSAVPDAISYNLYVSTDAALTQASGSAPGVFRYSGVASPRSVSGLDPTRVWFMLVTSVGADGETKGSGALAVRPIARGWGGLVPSAIGAWRVDGTVNRLLGRSVSGAGDVNADGWDDVIVGAPGQAVGDPGRAFVYLGSSFGLRTSFAAEIVGPVANSQFGGAVAGGGNIEGDAFADVLIGAPMQTGGNGRAAVYRGSATGINPTSPGGIDGGVSNLLGSSVAWMDAGGNAYPDLILGVPQYSSGSLREGAAWVHLADGAGGVVIGTDRLYEADNVDANLGTSVSALGDIDGNGYADLVMGAPGYDVPALGRLGRVYIARGTAGGLGSIEILATGPAISSLFGQSVAGVGDVDADGRKDLVVGVPGVGAGRAVLYRGQTGALPVEAGWNPVPGNVAAQFGAAVADAGDVNGDGYADVVVGSPLQRNPGNTVVGGALLFLGGPGGLSDVRSFEVLGPTGSFSKFGSAVASAGDVNGDGSDDLLVGAQGATSATGDLSAGSAYLYYGAPRAGPSVDAGAAQSGTSTTPISLGAATFVTPGAVRVITCTLRWGDGNEETLDPCTVGLLQSRAHAYSGAGDYAVRVRVTNGAYGTTGEAATRIHVD